MATDRLQEFLDSQVEGEVESEGGFTITSDKAIQKLAQMCLEDPHDWVLKAVQAAVAASATRLSFQQTRTGLTVEFFNIETPGLDEIEQAILSSNTGGGTFLSELVVGLRTLLFQGPFVVSVQSGECLFWEGKEFTRSHREPQKSQLSIWLLRKGWTITAARQAAAREQALRQRALYAPLELFYDGLRLDPDECLAARLIPREAFSNRRSTALVAASFEPSEGIRPMVATRKPARWLTDKLRMPGFLVNFEDPNPHTPQRIHYHTWAEYEDHPAAQNIEAKRVMLARSFYLQYTRLGVICGGLSFQNSIQGALQIPLDEARTDLSGLSLAPHHPRETTKPYVLEKIINFNEACCRELRANGAPLHLDTTDLKRTLTGTGGGTSVTTMTLMLDGLKFGLACKFGLGAGLLVGWWTLHSGVKKVTQDQLKVLISATERFNLSVSAPNFYSQSWSGL